jgi:hypothetical protein
MQQVDDALLNKLNRYFQEREKNTFSIVVVAGNKRFLFLVITWARRIKYKTQLSSTEIFARMIKGNCVLCGGRV